MADNMRYTTLLPAIKCSNCGLELEISMMGDHICETQDQGAEATIDLLSISNSNEEVPPIPPVQGSFSSQPPSNRYPPRNDCHAPTGFKPSYIDGDASNFDYTTREPLTPSSTTGFTRSASPMASNDNRQRDFRTPPRSSTVPIPRPPSPPPDLAYREDSEFFNQLGRSQTQQTAKSKPNLTLGPMIRNPEELPPVPPSPKPTGGANILKRMNTMARGPFSKTKQSGIDQSRDGQQHTDLHRREDSAASIYDSADHSPIVEQQARGLPSPAFPPEPRTPSPFSLSNNQAAKLDHYGQPLPTGPAPPRPSRPDGVSEFFNDNQFGTSRSILPASGPQDGYGVQTSISALPERNASLPMEPQSRLGHGSKLSTSFSTSPLTQSPERTPPRSRSRSSSTPRQMAFEDPSPQPLLSTQGYDVGNPYHAPSESASSIGSASGVGTRSASSRSSPPTSNASSFSQRHRSQGQNDVPETIDELSIHDEEEQSTIGAPHNFDPKPPTSPKDQWRNNTTGLPPGSSNFSRLRSPGPFEAPPSNAAKQPPTPLESPVDPTLPNGLFQEQDAYFQGLSGPRDVEQSTASRQIAGAWPPPPAIPESPPRFPRRVPVNKSNCRGCSLTISGKSVKAADGRLTGRYHKECFVCNTCKEPFQTADFYVINNHPYCGYHYHYLNNSLCTLCDMGIEGQFLETMDKKKFHPDCFRCQECHQPLQRDYFDVNGRTYCEEDAMKVHARNTRLGPGRRFPERRTTKLMMM